MTFSSLIWGILFDLGTYYVSLGFDPNFCATRQRFVGRIDNLAGRINDNFMAVIICLVSFDCNDRLALPCFGITSNLVLVDVNSFFHFTINVLFLPRKRKQNINLRNIYFAPDGRLHQESTRHHQLLLQRTHHQAP